MMKQMLLKMFLFSLMLFFFASSSHGDGTEKLKDRWYTQTQVENGSHVYKKSCLQCHGVEAKGLTTNWKKTLDDGTYPAPPLNGTAHAWHHPLYLLKRTINKGGIALGGTMPALENSLTEQEKTDVIAYFQHYWSDEIYNAWIERGGLE